MARVSGVQRRSPTSCPSSSAYAVTARPAYSGGAATQMFRAPRVLKTQATAPPVGAAVGSSGKGALLTWSVGEGGCCAGGAAGGGRGGGGGGEGVVIARRQH